MTIRYQLVEVRLPPTECVQTNQHVVANGNINHAKVEQIKREGLSVERGCDAGAT